MNGKVTACLASRPQRMMGYIAWPGSVGCTLTMHCGIPWEHPLNMQTPYKLVHWDKILQHTYFKQLQILHSCFRIPKSLLHKLKNLLITESSPVHLCRDDRTAYNCELVIVKIITKYTAAYANLHQLLVLKQTRLMRLLKGFLGTSDIIVYTWSCVWWSGRETCMNLNVIMCVSVPQNDTVRQTCMFLSSWKISIVLMTISWTVSWPIRHREAVLTSRAAWACCCGWGGGGCPPNGGTRGGVVMETAGDAGGGIPGEETWPAVPI